MKDFLMDLLAAINGLPTKVKATAGYLQPKENAVLYPLPGGQKTREDMAGNKEMTLNYEYVFRSKDPQKINEQLWTISMYLDELEDPADFPTNGKYVLESFSVTNTPTIDSADEKGFVVGVIDFNAVIQLEA
jgi:hypothetical protein